VTDEQTDIGSKTGSPESAESDEDRFRAAAVAADEILVRKSEKRERKKGYSPTPEQVALTFALANFSSAFMQALGQRAADGAAKLPKRMRDLMKTRVRRKGEPDEYRIGVRNGSAATIAITADTPDEARLALLDLDVTADAVRGKLLRWDSSASAWRPADDK
jgi:hypothetical protein